MSNETLPAATVIGKIRAAQGRLGQGDRRGAVQPPISRSRDLKPGPCCARRTTTPASEHRPQAAAAAMPGVLAVSPHGIFPAAAYGPIFQDRPAPGRRRGAPHGRAGGAAVAETAAWRATPWSASPSSTRCCPPRSRPRAGAPARAPLVQPRRQPAAGIRCQRRATGRRLCRGRRDLEETFQVRASPGLHGAGAGPGAVAPGWLADRLGQLAIAIP